MFDWIFSNRDVFLANYVEIGRNHKEAKNLQEEHNQFTTASNVRDLLNKALTGCPLKTGFQVYI